MSPLQTSTVTRGRVSEGEKIQLSILQFMSQSSQRECHSKPVTTSPTNIKSNTNLNDYNQQSIITYFTPPSFPKSPYTMPPDKPVKLPRRPSSPGINLDSTHLSYEINTPLPITKESPVHWRQTSIAQYFNIIPSMPVPLVPAHVHQTTTPKFRNVRQAVLSYRRKQRSVNKITRYTVSIPTYDLFDSWGHSLESIDANHTFRLFLQNPNGLSIHQNNHFLVHDLQQCYNYGAAVLCLPETNTNWDQSSQLTTLRSLFHKIWRKTSIQTSHTPDPFLSNHKPGGTLTAVCDNWVSRVLCKGEDPFGLGRWSYVTLRGRRSFKITIITAYNATVSPGDSTYYHQQMRIISQMHRQRNNLSVPDPRRQFILDLQAWIEFLRSEDHHIILALDANEVYDTDTIAQAHPLPYDPTVLTQAPTHDGKLATLVSSCGLCLPLAHQHTSRPFPASHIRGRNQIDYILVSQSILPAVQRSGVMSHHSLVRGDHRPYYLDFDSTLLFADPAYQIAPPSHRNLRLHDPRIVKQYNDNLHTQLGHHNVYKRLDSLQEKFDNKQWDATCVAEYESLDEIITASMLKAEQQLSKRVTSTYQWSPTLKKAVLALRYWTLRLRQSRNMPVSANQLERFRIDGGISDSSPALQSPTEVREAQHAAYQHLKSLQQQHQQLRDTYLEELAEAIILDRSPHLEDEKHAHILAEQRARQIKQIISREKMRRMFKKIGITLKKNYGGGLSRIDVPDASAASIVNGDPNNPKQWKGPWRSVTSPREIALEVCKINSSQYHQAHYTPFGSGQLADQLGRRGDTPLSQDLLRGTIPPNLPTDLLPETFRILHSLTREVPTSQSSPIITGEEFINTYKVAKENTSSSTSGRHIGHYKAACRDPVLVSLHSRMMSLPFQAGFAPQRWTKVTDIMLEKEPNNPRCHRLRILALFESDLNHAKRVIIGRRLLHHLNDMGLLPTMQHGSVPGKHCLSAVLKKILSHDYLRVTKLSGAFIENDAVGCYDRLVNNLVLMLMAKLGMPKTVIQCIGELWDNVVHLVKTVYGISSVSYGNTQEKPLYGPGQGSTCGPLFWLLCYWVIVSSIDPTLKVATFISACKSIIVEITGVSFVDDSSLSITSSYVIDPSLTAEENRHREVEHLVTALSALSQHWERLLFSTGGAINFQKSHWYLMTWMWKNGIPQLATVSQSPAHLALTTGTSTLLDHVPRLEATTGFRTLGVYVTPSGNFKRQAQVLRQHAESFKANILPSSLSPSEAYCCFMMYIRPKINYPLPCVSLTQAQCRYIQAPVLEAILPKLHLNRHTPRAVLFAGPRYGGISLPETYTDLGQGHLAYFLGHLKLGDETGALIKTLITHTQLQTGSVFPFFSLPYPTYSKWTDTTWVTDIWKYTHQAKLVVEVESHWKPHLSRQNDSAIMDFAVSLNLNHFQLICINTCRMHLQVTTLSDIVTAAGDTFVPSILAGQTDPHRPSSLKWPIIPSPPPSFWRQWQLLLQHLISGRRLSRPLGEWIAPPLNHWTWYKDLLGIVWFHDIKTDQWTTFEPQDSGSRHLTRSAVNSYLNGVPSERAPNHTMYPATILHRRDGSFRAITSTSLLAPTADQPPTNFWHQHEIPPPLSDTPPFFQHLINTPPTEEHCQEIATEIREHSLAVCSDGACDIERGISSHGEVFASSLLKQQIVTTTGPVDGHPSLVTSYRAELSGIIASLYLVYRICQYYNIETGTVRLYCDNKGALTNSFRPIYPGITPYLKTDHDLIEVVRALLAVIPVTVTHEWVKGHYTGTQRQFQHDLNDEADRVAGKFQLHQFPQRTMSKPLPPPGYKVRVLYESSVMTAKAARILVDAFHNKPIEDYIMKKAKWDRRTFLLVHWDAHERAFKRLHRYHQHSTAKLIHGLVNTNQQNLMYYGGDSTCPICKSAEETLLHVFTCPHASAVTTRQQSLQTLLSTLETAHTPSPVLDAIRHGFTSWHLQPTGSHARALTAGSLRGPDAVLTSAFHEQFCNLGWYHFCLGRVSKKWAAAVIQFTLPDRHPYTPLHWTSLLISALWKYSKSLWAYRNTVVHGATIEEQAQRMISSLHTSTTNRYTEFRANPQLVLPRHAYLFTSRPLEERLRAPYDTLAAWNRSVEEAIQVAQHHLASLRRAATLFFPSSQPSTMTDSDSTFSYESHSTLDTLSFAPTTTTAASTNTMSTVLSSDTFCRQIPGPPSSVSSELSSVVSTDSQSTASARSIGSSTTNTSLPQMSDSASTAAYSRWDSSCSRSAQHNMTLASVSSSFDLDASLFDDDSVDHPRVEDSSSTSQSTSSSIPTSISWSSA